MRERCGIPVLIFALSTLGLSGCSKKEEWTAPGPGNWSRVGPCEVCVESVRVGKFHGRGLWGDGESEEDVFIVRTKFRVQENGLEAKLNPWQHDGGLSFQFTKLTDEQGNDYKEKVAWGLMTEVEARLKKETTLKAGDPAAADLICFDAKAGQAEVLLLELPARWMVPAGNAWAFTREKGIFKFRIAKSFWQNALPEQKSKEEWPVVTLGRWYPAGDFAVSLQKVTVGKVKGRQILNEIVSKEDVFSIATQLRYTGGKGPVRVGSWQSEGSPIVRDGPRLQDAREQSFPPVQFGMMASVKGRLSGFKELTADTPPVADLLTFDAKAASADELFLDLRLSWYVREGKNDWKLQQEKPRFKLRLPRALWENAQTK